MYEIVEPKNRISKDAIKVWRITSVFTFFILMIIVTGGLGAAYYFEWPKWVKIILRIIFVVVPLYSIWSVFIRPRLLYKYWRYGIDEQYVRLKHGIFVRSDAVVPMTKIQFVEANQGPIMRKYNLYSLQIGTLGSSHDIPALPKDEAFALRDQISELAKLKEVE